VTLYLAGEPVASNALHKRTYSFTERSSRRWILAFAALEHESWLALSARRRSLYSRRARWIAARRSRIWLRNSSPHPIGSLATLANPLLH